MQKKGKSYCRASSHRLTQALILASSILSCPLLSAGTMGPLHSSGSSWSVLGSMGYTNYQGMYQKDGQTALGRFALAHTLGQLSALSLGVELGVQSGNTMRYVPSAATIDTLGGEPGLPIQTTIKPMLDVLLTTKTSLSSTTPLDVLVSAGLAYRRWQFNDRNSISDKAQAAPEVQMGLSYSLNERSRINVVYQGVFSGAPKFRFNPDNDSGSVSTIPAQHGVLLGVSVAL